MTIATDYPQTTVSAAPWGGRYAAGDVVVVTAAFSDTLTGAPLDPGTIQFTYGQRNAAPATAVGLAGGIERVAVGVYRFAVDTSPSVGGLALWLWQWQSGEVGAAAATGSFLVAGLPFSQTVGPEPSDPRTYGAGVYGAGVYGS